MIVENVDCYSSGIICRKFISINVGNSLLIFDDDSGSPVRPSTGSGCIDSRMLTGAGAEEGWGPSSLGLLSQQPRLNSSVRVRNTEVMSGCEGGVSSWGWAADLGVGGHPGLRNDHLCRSRVLRASWMRSRRSTRGKQGFSRWCISQGSTSPSYGTREPQCTSRLGHSGRYLHEQ